MMVLIYFKKQKTKHNKSSTGYFKMFLQAFKNSLGPFFSKTHFSTRSGVLGIGV